MANAVTLYIRPGVGLPDNGQWTNRFRIGSATSDRVYIISQNKAKRHWACSCPAYRTKRECRHLESLGLPSNERPYEPKIEKAAKA